MKFEIREDIREQMGIIVDIPDRTWDQRKKYRLEFILNHTHKEICEAKMYWDVDECDGYSDGNNGVGVISIDHIKRIIECKGVLH